jgi:hypothetical protein
MSLKALMAQALAHSLLVQVGGGRVNQPVAGFDGIDDAALALREIGDLEDAEAGDGHLNILRKMGPTVDVRLASE